MAERANSFSLHDFQWRRSLILKSFNVRCSPNAIIAHSLSSFFHNIFSCISFVPVVWRNEKRLLSMTWFGWIYLSRSHFDILSAMFLITIRVEMRCWSLITITNWKIDQHSELGLFDKLLSFMLWFTPLTPHMKYILQLQVKLYISSNSLGPLPYYSN